MRRHLRQHPDVERDAAMALAVLTAAAAVTGAPVADLVGYRRTHSELCAVRLAAAAALVGAGWSNERVVRHLRVDRQHLIDNGIIERMRRNAPRLLEAAEAVAGRRPDDRPITAVAREVMAAEATRAGVTMDDAVRSNGRDARDARRGAALRLYEMNYCGREIADALGFSENTIYRWLGLARLAC